MVLYVYKTFKYLIIDEDKIFIFLDPPKISIRIILIGTNGDAQSFGLVHHPINQLGIVNDTYRFLKFRLCCKFSNLVIIKHLGA